MPDLWLQLQARKDEVGEMDLQYLHADSAHDVYPYLCDVSLRLSLLSNC